VWQVEEFSDKEELNAWLFLHHGYRIIDIKYAAAQDYDRKHGQGEFVKTSMLVIYED
jgi:hypothetical protein